MRKKKLDKETILETYLNGMKLGIVSLYPTYKLKISDSARVDLECINIESVFGIFSAEKVDRWIHVNKQFGIETWADFGVFQHDLQSAIVNNDNPDLIRRVNRMSNEKKQQLSFCSDAWNEAYYSFIGTLRNLDSLNLLLRAVEQAQFSANANRASDSQNAPGAYEIEQGRSRMAIFLRQRISDLSGKQLQKVGVVVSGTLSTPVSRIQWIQILSDLSGSGYVHPKYASNRKVTIEWLGFALSFENENVLRSTSKNKLVWVGTPSALVEFLFKFIDNAGLSYNSVNKRLLYAWIDKSIAYKGKRDTLITIFKTYAKRNLNCFAVAINNDGSFSFRILHSARKVKSNSPE